ncbi:MAG: SPW repeat protein [Candidatus Bipolaricaulia bacterium]
MWMIIAPFVLGYRTAGIFNATIAGALVTAIAYGMTRIKVKVGG